MRPTSEDVAVYEVVIRGFEVAHRIDEDKKGKFLRAGKKIGKAIKRGDCKSNFLFVSMRKRLNNTEPTSDIPASRYSYIDPAPYLNRRFPSPGYKSACNGFSYYYIGMNAEDGDITGDPKNKTKKVSRRGKARSKSSNRRGRSVENQPDHPKWMQTFKENFNNITGNFDKYKNLLSKDIK